ncbi:hypothetical protein [Methylorubrum extorquens]|uniref:Uncharacterized protein n=1 Tax=Methylorubrum extorquens TaxID=408 RepID=A0AAX3WEZ8_METEX|nr:hypothetical protein [Methylorubrum extorquens]WHQ69437.1 hypothetical protein KEC54_24370 [Methylorubrum extorquens]
MSAPDLPLIAEAPFWQPATPEEFGLIVGEMPGPGDLDLAPGWQLSFFSVAQNDGVRHPQWGWVKGPFAVACSDCGDVATGVLTHLPTGFRIAEFYSDEQAAFAAEVLLPIADWPNVTPESAKAIRPGRILADAGFVNFAVWDGSRPVRILRRKLPERLQ